MIVGTPKQSVSIVIPCFNAGEFLDEAVQSALAQTWPELEVVIVDDGSRDPATLRLLERAPWARTRVFHQPNAGPAAARNYAIREARGTYILPLDADDTIDPTYAEKAVAVLESRPDVGCVYCKAMKFGAEIGPWNLPPYRVEELVVDNVIFVTAMFRKGDWQALGGFDQKLRHGVEDYDFWVKMVASGKDVVQLDEFLFNYRVQRNSRTTRFQGGRDAKIATYAKIFRNSQDFYVAHAEAMFRHRFDMYDQVETWRSRNGHAEDELEALKVEVQKRQQNLETEARVELAYWEDRYGGIDAFLERHPSFRKAVGRLKNKLGHKGRDEATAPPTSRSERNIGKHN